jgi:hypothetical protein
MKPKRIRLSFLTFACLTLACATLTQPAPFFDTDSINTMIVQTAQSALTLSAVPGFIPTTTPSLTLTPTQTGTPTPDYTFTPAIPIINVSVDTNCRNGPGKIYDYTGALLIGEISEIFARDPSGNYWYIRNPDKPSGFCWLWGKYASISGNTTLLPIYTPPPTPTPTSTPTMTPTPAPAPDFKAAYASMDSCAGWWLEFKVKNSGTVDLKSVEVVLYDKDMDKTISNLTDGFSDVNGCISTSTRDALPMGMSLIVSSPAFNFDPTGHEIHATITVCSKNGLNGLCATKKLKFAP